MRNQQKFSLLSMGLSATLGVFVLLAAVSAWQGARVSQVNARMERGSELLQLAEVWLQDAGQIVGVEVGAASSSEASAASEKARQDFFSRQMSAEARMRADEVMVVRRNWLSMRERLVALRGGAESEAQRRQIEQQFAALTQDYILATQQLSNALLSEVYAAGKELKELSGRLYMLGGGLLLSLLVFAGMLGWKLRSEVSVRDRADQRVPEPRPATEVASQEEISQLLQALKTIRD